MSPYRFSSVALVLASIGSFPVATSAAWSDMGTLPQGDICIGMDINDQGNAVGTCRDEDEDLVPVYWPRAQPPRLLPPLEADALCDAEAIGNDGTIAGNCQDDDGEFFPVRWSTATSVPSAPQRLSALPLHVKSGSVLVNHLGIVAGYSISNAGAIRAVIWKRDQVSATALPELGPLPPLLPASIGCEVTDMTNGASPLITGVCSLRVGGSVAVRWVPTGLGGAYVVHTLRPLAPDSSCAAIAINDSGQVAGHCESAANDLAAVRWESDGTMLAVLNRVEGVFPQQLQVIDMNASGRIVGQYLTASGRTSAFVWMPVENPDLEAAADLGNLGGFSTSVTAIADNNAAIGSAQDDVGAIRAVIGGATLIDLGTLPGGLASQAIAISDSGRHLVGISQNAEGQFRAVRQERSDKKMEQPSVPRKEPAQIHYSVLSSGSGRDMVGGTTNTYRTMYQFFTFKRSKTIAVRAKSAYIDANLWSLIRQSPMSGILVGRKDGI
ncbi:MULTISPECIES: hypothetical protein [unclassified Lysobacter]|uniref:hypothetical protein n=1 Tax=unclassified Lysobacter TaxID=2635362 RepID=UPI001BED2B6C|nr:MULTISPECIES: hypothetical protein [unclassified Lysobacter]MBT2749999.1 hypothetical protein [Lysobacter sp. ISL-50]MBT2779147.1 hypothetical protein [Lysobacter sp. ISL-54]MBT2783552.1 hypothetical protein [Lysobacter sp. ISL-52]